MNVLVVSGTGTGVGKTVMTAAVAALARAMGQRVAVLKPVQTGLVDGEPGDLAEVRRLAGEITTRELRRYPDPLSPEAAVRRCGASPVLPHEVTAAVNELAAGHEMVLVEGTGGLLVRFDPAGSTIADVAWALGAPVLLVAEAGLGTLNAVALSAEALARRGLKCAGVVVGRWPAEPDLATRCNLIDLPVAAGVPLVGVLPDGLAVVSTQTFLATARCSLSPVLGGDFDPAEFTARHPA